MGPMRESHNIKSGAWGDGTQRMVIRVGAAMVRIGNEGVVCPVWASSCTRLSRFRRVVHGHAMSWSLVILAVRRAD